MKAESPEPLTEHDVVTPEGFAPSFPAREAGCLTVGRQGRRGLERSCTFDVRVAAGCLATWLRDHWLQGRDSSGAPGPSSPSLGASGLDGPGAPDELRAEREAEGFDHRG